MIYELAHVIKDKCLFLWEFLEWGNSIAFSIRYRKGLKHLGKIVNADVPFPYEFKLAERSNVSNLHKFFYRQPKKAFTYFQPHGFDEKSLKKIIDRTSFLAFVLTKHEETKDKIVGYAFMRSFANGTSYRGYMVDVNHRGCGLAKIMGQAMNRVGDTLNLTMYKSISPKNPASMKATENVCNIEILRTLENGDYLIRCKSKPIDSMTKNLGGGNLASLRLVINRTSLPHKERRYAA